MEAQTVNVNWFLMSQSETAYTYVGQADVGGSQSFSIDVQVNLPQLDSFGGVFLFIQPVGNFFDFPATDAFVTRVLNIDRSSSRAVIHITRVDSQTGWDMNLQFNLLLINRVTYVETA